MPTENTLKRFLDAQEANYTDALAEIKRGKKQTHWMWYVFPQITGLGFSETAKYYSIHDLAEANAYFAHPLLGKRLIDISEAMLAIDGKTANQVLGSPDDMKLQSCMTLFGSLPNTDPVFQAVLEKFYNGKKDQKTIEILNRL
ncbi:DUF1810 domain-containing protein [Spirosoma aerophilum]